MKMLRLLLPMLALFTLTLTTAPQEVAAQDYYICPPEATPENCQKPPNWSGATFAVIDFEYWDASNGVWLFLGFTGWVRDQVPNWLEGIVAYLGLTTLLWNIIRLFLTPA